MMTKRKRHNSSLDGVYTPAAKGIETLDTLIPDSMDEGMQKIALLGSLTLYLDFINLFLMLLRIFGGNRD